MNIKDAELRAQALVFYETDIQAINSILEAFLKKSAARCALLVDQDGHMITASGDTDRIDLDTISALVAGSFAATKALAKQFGEEEFTALFHQGRSGRLSGNGLCSRHCSKTTRPSEWSGCTPTNPRSDSRRCSAGRPGRTTEHRSST